MFLTALKIGSITPIIKSGDLKIVSRISLSFFPNSICSALDHIFVDEQHSFRPGRSTAIYNLVLTYFVFDSFG